MKSTCQFDQDLPKPIKNNLCGVSSMCKIFNLFGKGPSDLKKVFNEFVSFGKYTLPTVNVTFRDYDLVSVPVMFLSETEDKIEDKVKDILGSEYALEIIEHNDKDYMPTFLLDRGSDSRGVAAYMQKYGFVSELVEKKAGTDNQFIEGFLARSAEGVIIASLSMEYLPHLSNVRGSYYAGVTEGLTHLVVVLPSKEGNMFTVWDPAVSTSFDDVIRIDRGVFNSALIPKGRARPHYIRIR